LRDSVPIDMLLSALSFLVVAQSSSEVPEGLMNNPVHCLGLSKQYGKKNSEISQFMKKIFLLSLLPQAEVGDCFALYFISSLPKDRLVEKFCFYLLESYIDADSIFPPPVWPECSAS